MDAILLREEPRGPFRFSVRQVEVDLPRLLVDFDEWDHHIYVQFRLSNFSRDFLVHRDDFFTPACVGMNIGRRLQYEGVSGSGLQQICHYILSQAQAIVNHERNSNRAIIPLYLLLEDEDEDEDENQSYQDENEDEAEGYQNEDEADNPLAHVIEESMHDNTYNPVPATKSSIEALEKFRLEDCSIASKELCIICMEQLSSMVDGCYSHAMLTPLPWRLHRPMVEHKSHVSIVSFSYAMCGSVIEPN